MLGVNFNFELLRADLLVKGAEWVLMPFKDDIITDINKKFAKDDGSVDVLGMKYTLEDINRLALETDDVVSGYRFEEGGSEGYMFTLLFANGQIVRAKTFNKNFCMEFYERILRKNTLVA